MSKQTEIVVIATTFILLLENPAKHKDDFDHLQNLFDANVTTDCLKEVIDECSLDPIVTKFMRTNLYNNLLNAGSNTKFTKLRTRITEEFSLTFHPLKKSDSHLDLNPKQTYGPIKFIKTWY